MKTFMQKLLQTSLITIGMFVAVGLPALVPVTVHADNVGEAQKGVREIGGTGSSNNANAFSNFIESIINLLLFVIGAVAVIMIIIGGIRYVTSNGDASQTKAARDTILYAIVGLVVAIMAYAIVNFVLNSLD